MASTTCTQVLAQSRSERLRNLEILKYGNGLRTAPAQVDNEEVIVQEQLQFPAPATAADAVLTALAQLAVWRMDCRRCYISLIDATEQHVLAEATRSISPFDATSFAPGDQLAFGVRSVLRKVGLSFVTVPFFMGTNQDHRTTALVCADETRFVVGDLQRELLVADVPYVQSDPNQHFFAEVPLRNSTGTMVGTMGVLDERPRANAVAVDVEPMTQIARLVIDHLELIGMKETTKRAGRLMQGLGNFNIGLASISPCAAGNTGRPPATDKRVSRKRSPASETFTAIAPDVTLTPTENKPLQEEASPTSSSVTPSTRQQSSYNPFAISFASASISSRTDATSVTPSDELAIEFNPSVSPYGHDHAPLSLEFSGMGASTDDQDHALADAVVCDVFSRASNLIRESMDIDGTCFLEISPDGRFDINTPRRSREPAWHSSARAQGDSLECNDESNGSGPSDVDERGYTFPSGTTARAQTTQVPAKRRVCRQLGYSYSSSSARQDSGSTSMVNLSEKTLSKLAALYPAGHIFDFDSLGALSSADEDSMDDSSVPRRRKLVDALDESFPEARSLIFVPLYDNERQHLYAGFFGWTESAYRILVEQESLYVSIFTNSVMCEIMRLEALALDKSKSTFVSSVSHELRSPLHGILAATELMQEAQPSSDQVELLTMIDSCSLTLLDVMDNLLEYAKINNTATSSTRFRTDKQRRPRRPADPADIPSPSSDKSPVTADLARIVEETVVSVAAGHLIQKKRHLPSESQQVSLDCPALDRTPSPGDQISANTLSHAPIVIVDIKDGKDWQHSIDVGALRRIVVNLVGNALKYTSQGHVHVQLHMESEQNQASKRVTDRMILTVSDTGRGISKNFLKHRLYTPFAQEDSLSVGVGLGLSIVGRLVAGLGGEISVDSEVNVGTQFIVTVPFRSSHTSSRRVCTDTGSSPTSLQQPLATGQTLCLIGFDLYPILESIPTGIMSHHASALLKLKQSLTMLAQTWHGLKLTSDSQEATIFMVEEMFAVWALKNNPNHPIFHRPHIIVKTSGPDNSGDVPWKGRPHNVLCPIGPRKFAHALSSVLLRQTENDHSAPGWLPSSETKADDSGETVKAVVEQPASLLLSSSPPVTCTDLPTPPVSQPPTPAVSRGRFLLVEDNDINLRILVNLMKKLKLPFETAVDGKVALDQYTSSVETGNPISCILMDINMPVMDGLTSTRLIRAYEKEHSIETPAEIIALTGLGDEEFQQKAKACGMDQYYRKPVRLDTLRKLLIVDR